ncbi:MAG: hypothetical protein WBQ44_11675 [Rhodococcus sp. (in: high G+C Gram-positive bacteria)]
MNKTLVAVGCAFALTGCAGTVDGTAVAEEAWEGRGIALPTTTTTTTTTTATFDPCDLPLEVLKKLDLVGTSPRPLAADLTGCVWSNATFAVGVQIVPGVTEFSDPHTNPRNSEVEELTYQDYLTYMFVFEGDGYVTQTMTEVGAVSINISSRGSMDAARASMIGTFETIAPFLPPPL